MSDSAKDPMADMAVFYLPNTIEQSWKLHFELLKQHEKEEAERKHYEKNRVIALVNECIARSIKRLIKNTSWVDLNLPENIHSYKDEREEIWEEFLRVGIVLNYVERKGVMRGMILYAHLQGVGGGPLPYLGEFNEIMYCDFPATMQDKEGKIIGTCYKAKKQE